ncbi:hypothetical protein ACWIUD_07960 [Helicobacter sp. 23-1044]
MKIALDSAKLGQILQFAESARKITQNSQNLNTFGTNLAYLIIKFLEFFQKGFYYGN